MLVLDATCRASSRTLTVITAYNSVFWGHTPVEPHKTTSSLQVSTQQHMAAHTYIGVISDLNSSPRGWTAVLVQHLLVAARQLDAVGGAANMLLLVLAVVWPNFCSLYSN